MSDESEALRFAVCILWDKLHFNPNPEQEVSVAIAKDNRANVICLCRMVAERTDGAVREHYLERIRLLGGDTKEL